MLIRKMESVEQKREAIAALYESHFERITRYITARIGHPHDAEDLASEVFTRALAAAASYQNTGAPMEAWVFRIAHNVVVDHLRKKSRRPASVSIDDCCMRCNDSDLCDALIHQQELAELKLALSCLSHSQREVLSLRFGGELTSVEVAEILGKRAGAVREMQSAAIKKLRDRLNLPGYHHWAST